MAIISGLSRCFVDMDLTVWDLSADCTASAFARGQLIYVSIAIRVLRNIMSSLHSGYLPNPIIGVFWVLGVQFEPRLGGKIISGLW